MRNLRTFIRFGAACAAFAFSGCLQAVHAGDAHEHHHHMADMSPGYARRAANYQVPKTELVRSDGAKTVFPEAINDGKPVVLDFIYTTCTAVCPILSQAFAEFQDRLGPDRDKVHMVSISIDPEEDTPQRLAAYARRFEAGDQWGFYTGTVKASETMQRAFQAYFGDKMHHRPLTFMREAPGAPWVRLEGFASPDDLIAEYRHMVHR